MVVVHFTKKEDILYSCDNCGLTIRHPRCKKREAATNAGKVYASAAQITFWNCKELGCVGRAWHSHESGAICIPIDCDSDGLNLQKQQTESVASTSRQRTVDETAEPSNVRYVTCKCGLVVFGHIHQVQSIRMLTDNVVIGDGISGNFATP